MNWIILAVLLWGIDQIIKGILIASMSVNAVTTVIPDFFAITHIRNTGAAWSTMDGNVLFLIAIALLSLIAIYFFFLHQKKLTTLEWISYGGLIGGILGNVTDRIVHGYVVDYLQFQFGTYIFPIFNFADICIVVSVFLLIIQILKGGNIHGNMDHHKRRNGQSH